MNKMKQQCNECLTIFTGFGSNTCPECEGKLHEILEIKQEECCEKCLMKKEFNGECCKNQFCSCHSSQPKPSWEESFDEEFIGWDNPEIDWKTGESVQKQNNKSPSVIGERAKFKSFISSTVSEAIKKDRAEIVEKGQERKHWYHIQWEGIDDPIESKKRKEYNIMFSEIYSQAIDDFINLIKEK